VVGMAPGRPAWQEAALVGRAGRARPVAPLLGSADGLATSNGLSGAIASLGGNGGGFAALRCWGSSLVWMFWQRRTFTGRPLQ